MTQGNNTTHQVVGKYSVALTPEIVSHRFQSKTKFWLKNWTFLAIFHAFLKFDSKIKLLLKTPILHPIWLFLTERNFHSKLHFFWIVKTRNSVSKSKNLINAPKFFAHFQLSSFVYKQKITFWIQIQKLARFNALRQVATLPI